MTFKIGKLYLQTSGFVFLKVFSDGSRTVPRRSTVYSICNRMSQIFRMEKQVVVLAKYVEDPKLTIF